MTIIQSTAYVHIIHKQTITHTLLHMFIERKKREERERETHATVTNFAHAQYSSVV